jgi:hypothetical protein
MALKQRDVVDGTAGKCALRLRSFLGSALECVVLCAVHPGPADDGGTIWFEPSATLNVYLAPNPGEAQGVGFSLTFRAPRLQRPVLLVPSPVRSYRCWSRLDENEVVVD